MRIGIILLFILLPFLSLGQQWKSYTLSKRGDTINKIDNKNLKQGKWFEMNEGGYGDDSYYTTGEYYDNKKYGRWRSFNTSGIILLEENFKNGYRDGKIKYYDNGYLVCVGNYLALRTDQAYDTILVEDPDSDVLIEKVVETSLGSVKHGFWTFYKIPGFEIDKIREYQADELIYEKEYTTKADSAFIRKRQSALPHKANGPPQSIWISKEDKNRKPARYTDFPENVDYVKPNIRRPKNVINR